MANERECPGVIYKRHCDACGRYYEGRGKKYCSRPCRPSPMKGKKHTESSRQLMGEHHRGSGMAGKSHSIFTRKRMSESHQGINPSEETREKIRKALTGRVYSQETLKKMSEGQLGRTASDETRIRMSESHKGEKNYLWRGGRRICAVINSAKRRTRKKEAQGNISQAEWASIKELYGNACLSCGKTESEITLTMDHVIPLSIGGSNGKENIQPLCGSCNSKKRTKHIDYRPVFAERATA